MILMLRLRTISLGSFAIYMELKVPKCYKNPANLTCIDLMLATSNQSFQNFCTIKIGLVDFYKMNVIVLKTCFLNTKPKVINYRDCLSFSNEEFRNSKRSLQSKPK